MSGAPWNGRRGSRGPGDMRRSELIGGKRERHRWLDRGLVLAFVALAVAAIVNGLRSGAESSVPSPEPSGKTEPKRVDEAQELPTILPLSGDLRAEGGVLWWSDVRCQAKALDLSSGAVSRIPAEHCRIWPAPSGSRVIVTATSRSDALDGKGLVQFSYPPPEGSQVLEGQTVLRHEPGVIASEVVWPRGEGVALACVATRDGTIVTGVGADPLLAPGFGVQRDSCFPAVLPDGRYASVVGPATIVVDGRSLLSDAELERLLPSVPRRARRVVSALGAGDGEVVAAVAAIVKGRLLPSSAALAVVTAKGKVRFSAALRSDVLPAEVGLSPLGDAVWYFDAANGNAHVMGVPDGRELSPDGARWVAWSPSGDYLAAAGERSVQIFTWPDGAEVDQLPAAANVLAWTHAPAG
jgi:hypothetical protein